MSASGLDDAALVEVIGQVRHEVQAGGDAGRLEPGQTIGQGVQQGIAALAVDHRMRAAAGTRVAERGRRHDSEGIPVMRDVQRKSGWRERRRAAKREKEERMGDSPEKRAEPKASDPDVKDAAGGAAIRGAAIGGGIGGGGGGM